MKAGRTAQLACLRSGEAEGRPDWQAGRGIRHGDVRAVAQRRQTDYRLQRHHTFEFTSEHSYLHNQHS